MFYLIDYYILQRFQRRTDSGQPTRLTVVVSRADEQVHQDVLVLAVLRVHLGGSPIAPSLLPPGREEPIGVAARVARARREGHLRVLRRAEPISRHRLLGRLLMELVDDRAQVSAATRRRQDCHGLVPAVVVRTLHYRCPFRPLPLVPHAHAGNMPHLE